MAEKVVVLDRLLPPESTKRGGKMFPRFITIHETSLGTAIQPADKNYEWYHNMLLRNDSDVGYHFLVETNYDDVARVYQFLETTVIGYHTGSTMGNAESIGIERLVNVNTDMVRAISLQARLAATLMAKYDISIRNVVPHKYWSKKECPARLLAGMYGGWEEFIERVKYYFSKREIIKGIQ